MNREGAIAGMLAGLGFTAAYIVWFKFVDASPASRERWLLGISPEGIGTAGALINVVVSVVVARLTPPPPQDVQDLVESIRVPR